MDKFINSDSSIRPFDFFIASFSQYDIGEFHFVKILHNTFPVDPEFGTSYRGIGSYEISILNFTDFKFNPDDEIGVNSGYRYMSTPGCYLISQLDTNHNIINVLNQDSFFSDFDVFGEVFIIYKKYY